MTETQLLICDKNIKSSFTYYWALFKSDKNCDISGTYTINKILLTAFSISFHIYRKIYIKLIQVENPYNVGLFFST